MTLNRHHGADSQFPERETLDSLIPANVLSHEVCVFTEVVQCRSEGTGGHGTRTVHGSDSSSGRGGRGRKNVEIDLFLIYSVLGLSFQNRPIKGLCKISGARFELV